MGKREGREREGRGRWDWDPSTRDGKRERNGGKDGGRRVGKGMGRKGRGGEEISIHGLKHVAPPMHYITDTFKRRLDKFWQHQHILYDYKVELTGVGNRSQINIRMITSYYNCNFALFIFRLH